MGVVLHLVQKPLLPQILEDARGAFGDVSVSEEAEALQENPLLVQRGDGREIMLLAQREVLRTAARGHMDDAGALRLPHLVPQDHPVGLGTAGGLLGLQFVEGAVVGPAFQRCPIHLLQHLTLAPQDGEGPLGEIEDFVPLAHLHVGQFRPYRRRDVAGKGPGGGGPDQETLPRPLPQREAQRDAGVGHLPVPLGDYLVLADAGGAAGAPGHHIAPLVKPAPLPAALKHRPDHIVVLSGEGEVGAAQFRQTQPAHDPFHRVGHRPVRPLDGDDLLRSLHKPVGQIAQGVRAVPVHPVPQADGLLGLHSSVAEHSLLALAHETGNAVLLDVPLGVKTLLLLHLDLDPKTLAVEAILIAGTIAFHRPEAMV